MAKVYGIGNLDTRLSASMETYIQKMPQNVIFNRHPALSMFRRNALMKNGGESISVPIEYVIPSNVGSYSGFQTLNTTPQDFATTANFRFRQYYGTVNISGQMRRENASDNVFDIVQATAQNEMKGIVDKVSTDIWASAQSGTSLDTIPAYAATTGTVGSISATGNTWWQATATTSGSFAAQGVDDMRTTFNTVSNEGGEMPDLICTTQTVFEYVEKFALVKTKIDFPRTGNTDLGFDNFSFKGATIVWDLDVPASQMFFINTDYTYLVIDSGVNFKTRGFVEARDGDHATNLILFRGNLVTAKRSSLGIMSSITA